MPNALIKQRESIGYVDTILKGIHEIDEAKVFGGLKRLRNIDFSNLETPLSPSFDLITGISPGREDFLTLELKHLLALVIRHMAQGVYQWTQQQNKGVANVTQQELTKSLGKLIELLEPTKDPCIAAITNLHCAKAIASCLAMPASTTGDEWWDRLIFVGELIGDSLQLAAGITTGQADISFKAGLLILQRLYKPMSEMLKEANAQTLVMQIAAVNAWKGIMLHPGSNAEELSKKQVEKTIEGLKQYLEERILSEKSVWTKVWKKIWTIIKDNDVKRTKDEVITKLNKAKLPFSERIVALISLELIDLLKDPEKHQDLKIKEGIEGTKIIEKLRNIAFHALVDLYVETADESVRCEILKVFGALARSLCQESSFDDKQLNSLIDKSGPIKASDPNVIEQAALRILVEAIWPTVFENDDPVALSLTSGKAVELSKKWQIQCTALEELLRFEAYYLKHKGDESTKEAKTPITSFLDEMGREYQVTALLVNKFGLIKGEIVQLRDFLHYAKRLQNVEQLLHLQSLRTWISKTFSLQKVDIEILLKEGKIQQNKISAILQNKISAILHIKQVLSREKKDGLSNLASSGQLVQELGIEHSDVDLIFDFLNGEISQKKLAEKEKAINNLLREKLELQGEERKKLIEFLQKEKDQQPAQPQQEKYSKEPVRPVLDKLINQFNLTQTERNLIDETIFQGKSSDTAKESLIAKVGEALKSFFGQDNYPKIACAFNNLDRIRAMIKEERLLLGKRGG